MNTLLNTQKQASTVWLPHGGHAHRVSDRVAVPRERGERGVNG